MADDKSLVKIEKLQNVLGLSKPLTRLMDRIFDLTGILYEPRRIRSVAQAEADADLIKTQGQLKNKELQQRAALRFISEEAKKQENMESIIEKAIPFVTEDSSKPDEMEDDWIVNFFDKCRLISDDEMQQLWSKILAGEANAPRTYSKRTVNLLGSLEKRDADLFTSLCSFILKMSGRAIPLIYDHNAEIYNKQNVGFEAFSHLSDIGLISFDFAAGFTLNLSQRTFIANYFGTNIFVEGPENGKNNKTNGFSIESGSAILTISGHELAQICNPKPVDGFLDHVLENWKKQSLKANIINK